VGGEGRPARSGAETKARGQPRGALSRIRDERSNFAGHVLARQVLARGRKGEPFFRLLPADEFSRVRSPPLIPSRHFARPYLTRQPASFRMVLWSAIAISLMNPSKDRAKEGESVDCDVARSLPREIRIDLIGFDRRGENDDSER